jgi:hypothetical protein
MKFGTLRLLAKSSNETAEPFRQRGRNFLFYPALTLFAVLLLWLSPELVYETRRAASLPVFDEVWLRVLSSLAVLGSVLWLAVRSIYLLLRRRGAAELLANLLVGVLMMALLVYAHRANRAIELVKLRLLAGRYEACEKLARENAFSFRTCDGRLSGDDVHFVVVDGNGLLSRPREDWSREFHRFMTDQDPAFVECRLATTLIARSLYLIESLCGR